MGVSTKELTNVPGLPPEEIVVIRKLGYGSLSILRDNSAITEVNARSGESNTAIKLGQYMKWLVALGISKLSLFNNCVTFEDKVRAIERDQLPSETGEYLFQEIEKFNNFRGNDDLKKK